MDHCNKLGHTKDKCWLSQRKPTNWRARQSDGRGFQVAADAGTTSKREESATIQISLSKEQMDMYKLLNQSQQPNTNVGSCNLAQTSNLLAAHSVTKKFKSTLDHRFRCFRSYDRYFSIVFFIHSLF